MATTTWTQTAGMTSDEDVDNVDSFAEQAEASKDAAAASATAAAASESSASASASSASASATTATTKAAEASTSATNAATSASSASSSATSATASETAAATSKNAAAASATAAAASETAAAASETAAASSETNAATSETNAATSATSASTSATTASTAATTASTAATNAATSETNAATSASTASTAATNAATSETNAATSATNAATSATNAATSETNAATSASSASTSASAASTSATAAAASQSAAAASAASAASAYDTFDDRYLGSKTADPTVDNDGDALVSGALYFNSTANEMRVYDGANWIAATSAGNASLLEYKYTATSGQTTFSGADDSANTLSYTQDNLIVTLNGVVLENGTDYTATTGTSVVLASGAATSDELNVIAFKSFTTADMVSSANGGTFYNNIDVQGTVTADGLTVDAPSANYGYSAILNSSSNANLYFGHQSSVANNRMYISHNWYRDGSGYSADDTSHGLGTISFNNGQIQLGTEAAGSSVTKQRITVENNGDISFYEDTGTTAKFFWDASAESLGIGTSSIYSTAVNRSSLSVNGVTDAIISLGNGTTENGFLYANASNTITGTRTATPYIFYTNNTERMRIDSSGNVGIGTSSPLAKLDVASSASVTQARVRNQSTGAAAILFQNSDTGTSNGDGLYLGRSAGINYLWTYENEPLVLATDNLERMRIDSSGRVGIGTASPHLYYASQLVVDAPDENGITIVGDTTHQNYIMFADGSSGSDRYRGYIGYDHSTDAMQLTSGGIQKFLVNDTAEAMRIDSSGNLLVGKTSGPNYNAVGIDLTYLGEGQFTTDNRAVLQINRQNSDGDLVVFRKDGTTVGSIGTFNSYPYFGKGDTTLMVVDALDAIFPRGSNGVSRNGAISLGDSGDRFKDLYLSGGVYLGGTGAANKLDDYEIGSWSPVMSVNGFNQSVGTITGRYVKVGNIVYASCLVTFGTAAYASNWGRLTTLPFLANSGYGVGGYTSGALAAAAKGGTALAESSSIYFHSAVNTATATTWNFSVVYETL